MTLEEVGEGAGLSAAATYQRIKKLETQGVIAGYHARVAPQHVDRGVVAFVRVEPGAATDTSRLEASWQTAREVLECHRLAADDSYLLKLRVSGLAAVGAHLEAARRAGCRARAELVWQPVFERWDIVAG